MIVVKTSSIGKSSLADVSEFLLFLWNIKILQQFIDLIENAQKQLQENPTIGNHLLRIFAKLYFTKMLQCIINMMKLIKLSLFYFLLTIGKTQKII